MMMINLIFSFLMGWSPYGELSDPCSQILSNTEACESPNPFLDEYQSRLPRLQKTHREYKDTLDNLIVEIRYNMKVMSEEAYSDADIYQYYSQMSSKARKLEADMYIRKEVIPLANTFAWAIPNEAAIHTISKYGPIVELGAGKGYWAYLLNQHNVDIVAYDKTLPDQLWFPVLRGDESSLLQHQERTLLLCWPPPQGHYPLASRSLSLFKGKHVIYIGEDQNGGATADTEFFKILESDFKLIETVQIPQYPGYSDKLYVYEKRFYKHHKSNDG